MTISTDAIPALAGLSRPKIHRLPQPASRGDELKKKIAAVREKLAGKPVLYSLNALLALTLLGVLMNGFISLAAHTIGGLPSFSAKESNPTLINEAMASTLSSDSEKTFVIKGDSGSIVGQMAHISQDGGKLADIKTMSHVDKDSGRELLSIVNKY